jgi:hypothetical protein
LAYIGTIPAEAYTSFAVQHFTTSATTSYTLDNPVANENEIALFINNVRQEPGSSYAYTASGTTLTLSAATTISDTMYCVFIGKAVQTVTPAVGSVTNDMLAGSIANAKLANSSITLNGSAVSLGGSVTLASGITQADIWRLTTSFTGSASPISSNWERADDASFSKIGTGMTESSGVFTFPSTGIWWVIYHCQIQLNDSADNQVFATLNHSPDSGTTLDVVSYGLTGDGQTGSRNTVVSSSFVDITDTSTHSVRFVVESQDAGNTTVGSSTENQTWVEFIRLGDT